MSIIRNLLSQKQYLNETSNKFFHNFTYKLLYDFTEIVPLEQGLNDL